MYAPSDTETTTDAQTAKDKGRYLLLSRHRKHLVLVKVGDLAELQD